MSNACGCQAWLQVLNSETRAADILQNVKVFHDSDDDDDNANDAKAIAIPQIFSENNQAKNVQLFLRIE